jgi:cytochrome c biogenesis protein CcmG/thiol:disulfide interchange protein DsbE
MLTETTRWNDWRGRSAILLGLLLTLFSTGPARATELDLSAYRGKVVYVDFWASWCGPCRESFPWLDTLMREYGGKNLVVIGVNVDHDRDRAERFLNETPAVFPIVYDPQGDIATTFKVTGMPNAILIDRNGKVRFQHTGFSAKKKGEYEDQLRSLLDETTH